MKLPVMKNVSKNISKIIIIQLLFFVLILPSAQTTNVFEDIKNIDNGITEINSKLASLGSDINELGETMKAINTTMENVQQNVALLEDTNKEIKDMNEKLEEVSNKATGALDLAEKVNSYMANIAFILSIGVISIILAILTLTGITFILMKKKKVK